MASRSAIGLLALAALFTITVRAWCQPEAKTIAVARSTAPAEVRRLIDQLGDDKYLKREQATRVLVALGRRVLPQVQQATHSQDAEVSLRAQRIVLEIQSSVTYLVDTLQAADVAERREAAAGLERLGDGARAALPALLVALKDTDETVRDSVVGTLLAIDPFHAAIAEHVPPRAHADGKYSKLLRRLKIPADRQSYSEFRDYGLYQACDWAGYTNIPAGYWVYVYPYWYIWREETAKASP